MGSEKMIFTWSLKESRLNCFARQAPLLKTIFSNLHAKLHRLEQETGDNTHKHRYVYSIGC